LQKPIRFIFFKKPYPLAVCQNGFKKADTLSGGCESFSAQIRASFELARFFRSAQNPLFKERTGSMKNTVCDVKFELLESFMQEVFRRIGVPEEDARVCAEVLISADRRGIDSHGVGRLKTIYYDRIVHQKIQQPVTEFEIVRDRGATAVVTDITAWAW
jgi:hypothetical protein